MECDRSICTQNEYNGISCEECKGMMSKEFNYETVVEYDPITKSYKTGRIRHPKSNNIDQSDTQEVKTDIEVLSDQIQIIKDVLYSMNERISLIENILKRKGADDDGK